MMHDAHAIENATKLRLSDLPGPVLILAPHADDESLGCGGLIAALAEENIPVHVWLVSDGTMSHPNSVAFPPEQRRSIREEEFNRACQRLGVAFERLQFFRFPDTRVPLPGAPYFADAATQVAEKLRELNPKAIFTPWRRDPHCDHRATTALIRTAIFQTNWKGDLYEYPIWLYELAARSDVPRPDEVEVLTFELDENLLFKKKKAIETHASQLGQIIHDDPKAFSLQPQVLAHFLTPTEYYYRSHEQ
ncbi:PIG-L deacetylase family protein [Persicitalea sp.]|uniref:PIG-L deacetylase family protein n=1 Tax=Persicitalea sp. TaxID=3100273 RepID=UPI0035943428